MLDEPLVVAIIVARLFIPLLIPRVPLVIFVVLVLDAADQTLLATYTDVDTTENGSYQSVDKALDIYYLSIAYLATLRNWKSHPAFRIARFLFYYRLVGAAAFELTEERALLVIFPNTHSSSSSSPTRSRGCVMTRGAYPGGRGCSPPRPSGSSSSSRRSTGSTSRNSTSQTRSAITPPSRSP